MSSLTSCVAVAVKPATTGFPKCSTARLNRKYEGRKSCPHCEIQCASSTAKKETLTPFKSSKKSLELNRSGAT